MDSEYSENQEELKDAAWQRFRGNDFSRMTEPESSFQMDKSADNHTLYNQDNSELIIKEEDPLEVLHLDRNGQNMRSKTSLHDSMRNST